MTRLINILFLSSIIIVLGPLSGCKQQEGDRCQLDSDCDEPLKCCIVSADKRLFGGTCALQCEITSPTDGGGGGTSDARVDGQSFLDIGPINDLHSADIAPDTKPASDAPIKLDSGKLDSGKLDSGKLDNQMIPDLSPNLDHSLADTTS